MVLLKEANTDLYTLLYYRTSLPIPNIKMIEVIMIDVLILKRASHDQTLRTRLQLNVSIPEAKRLLCLAFSSKQCLWLHNILLR